MSCLKYVWHACQEWWRDTTDPMLLSSPFLDRESLPKVLGAYNIFWGLDHYALTQLYFPSGHRQNLIGGLRVLFVLLLALILCCPSVYRSNALKVEAASSVIMSVGMTSLTANNASLFMWLYWLLQISLLLKVKLHPLSLLAPVALMTATVIATGSEDLFLDGTWRTPGLLQNVQMKKVLLVCLYPVATWFWYLYSFTSKIYAIKHGRILSERRGSLATDCENQPLVLAWVERWWKRSTHECVVDSPLSSRNLPAAFVCSVVLWCGHAVYMDIVVRFLQVPANQHCQLVSPLLRHSLLGSAISLLALLMTACFTSCLQSLGCLSYALTQDLPLMVCVLAPCAMNYNVHVWLRESTCLTAKSQFSMFSLPVVEFGILQAVFILSLSHAHPVIMCLAVTLCFLGMTFYQGAVPVILNLYPYSVAQFLVSAAFLIVLHTWDHTSVVRCIWAAVERSEANAQSLEQLRSWHEDGRESFSLELMEHTPPREVLRTPMPARSLRSIAEEMQISMGSRSGHGSRPPSCSPEEEGHRHATLEEEGLTLAIPPDSGGTCTEEPQASVAVLRHAERQDAVFDAGWHQTEDAKKFPGDCPITDEGVLAAKQVAQSLREFGDYGIIVSSPYLRCVQTALAIADELDLVVLLDHELGEVFGPDIFGETGPSARAWRSRHELHKALEAWRPTLEHGFSQPPTQRVCWQRVLGTAPKWGERIPAARQRYARRFLRYLSRSRRGNKNLIVVSHGIMVQTCLKVLPSTVTWAVGSVPYCSGFMAHFWQKSSSFTPKGELQEDATFMITEADMQVVPSPDAEDVTGSTSLSLGGLASRQQSAQQGRAAESAPPQSPTSDEDENAQLRNARLQWWEVHVFGVDVHYEQHSPRSLTRFRDRYQDYLDSLRSDCFSWQNLHSLLGDLPNEVPLEAFQSLDEQANSFDLSSDTGTRSSMEIFRRPRILSLQTDSAATEAVDDFGTEPMSPVSTPVRAPALNLKGSSLMGRRGRLNLTLGA